MSIRMLFAGIAAIAWLLAVGCTAWAFGALSFDFPFAPHFVSWGYLILLLAWSLGVRGALRKLGGIFLAFAAVAVWWNCLAPSNDRDWQPDVAETAWAEIGEDRVILHNVRNCDYRTETDFTPRYDTRTVSLSKLTGVDIAVNYWGSPWMAHPIVSFQFADAPPVCFSIETRKTVGETYSAVGGLYRQYELIYVVAEERDVIRVRTNYRKHEQIYLYRMTLPIAETRERFLEYLHSLNMLRDHPRWYNAITTNCTTSIRAQHPPHQRLQWDWRILVNGKGDEMMYERRRIVTDGLPFAELKARALINSAAQAADAVPDFSSLIRKDRPGFSDWKPLAMP